MNFVSEKKNNLYNVVHHCIEREEKESSTCCWVIRCATFKSRKKKKEVKRNLNIDELFHSSRQLEWKKENDEYVWIIISFALFKATLLRRSVWCGIKWNGFFFPI